MEKGERRKMIIDVNSKFEIGDIKKLKGSDTQNFLITEIYILISSGGIRIGYKGTMLNKQQKYGSIPKDWQGTGISTNKEIDIWSVEKGLLTIEELELE